MQEILGVAPMHALNGGVRVLKVASKSPNVAVMAGAAAMKTVARHAGGAAFFGAVVDLATSSVQAVRDVRSGEMTTKEGLAHVAKETGKGGVASAAGVLATVGLIALTGPIAPAYVFLTGVTAAIAARSALDEIV